MHAFRPPTSNHPSGGGLVLIHRDSITVQPSRLEVPSPTSFEMQVLRIRSCKSPIRIVNVYRPPDRSLSQFHEEFQTVISTISTSTTDRLIICGDLNAPGIDDHSVSPELAEVIDILDLKQHVRSATRLDPDHLLDVFITDPALQIRDVDVVDTGMASDHQLIVATASVDPVNTHHSVPFTYRHINDIDPMDFESRLRRSSLYTSPAATAEQFAEQLENVVVQTLDVVAPLRTRIRRKSKVKSII